MSPQRGEIWWVELDPTRGGEINKMRPCVVFSTDRLNERRKTIVVIPLSSSPTARPPLTVAVTSAGRPAVAVLDQIRATAKERFRTKLGTLSGAEMEGIEENLRVVLAMS